MIDVQDQRDNLIANLSAKIGVLTARIDALTTKLNEMNAAVISTSNTVASMHDRLSPLEGMADDIRKIHDLIEG